MYQHPIIPMEYLWNHRRTTREYVSTQVAWIVIYSLHHWSRSWTSRPGTRCSTGSTVEYRVKSVKSAYSYADGTYLAYVLLVVHAGNVLFCTANALSTHSDVNNGTVDRPIHSTGKQRQSTGEHTSTSWSTLLHINQNDQIHTSQQHTIYYTSMNMTVEG